MCDVPFEDLCIRKEYYKMKSPDDSTIWEREHCWKDLQQEGELNAYTSMMAFGNRWVLLRDKNYLGRFNSK